MATAAWAACLLGDGVVGLARSTGTGRALAISLTLGVAFGGAMVAALAWVGWRLWARWDQTTVRVVVGGGIGFAVVWLGGVLGDVAGRRWGPGATATVMSGVLLVGLVAGAVVYRRATRAVIASAGLGGPPDRHGPTAGHVGRAQAFCSLLGWAVWMAASAAANWAGWDRVGHGSGLRDGAVVFGPILLGWAAYKVARRRLLPRPPKAAPAGGFEVLPVPPVE